MSSANSPAQVPEPLPSWIELRYGTPNPLPTWVRVRHYVLASIAVLLLLAGAIWLTLATAPLRERKPPEARHQVFFRNGVSASAAGMVMALLAIYLLRHFYRTPAGRPFLHAGLVKQLSTVRSFISRPGNDFAGSPWRDADALLAEFDPLVDPLHADQRPNRAQLDELFRYGSDLRALGKRNGWERQYLELAPRVRFFLRFFHREG